MYLNGVPRNCSCGRYFPDEEMESRLNSGDFTCDECKEKERIRWKHMVPCLT